MRKLIIESTEIKTAYDLYELCPLCGDENLDYGDSEIVENDVVYTWDCPSCGADGKEFYSLEFSSHGEVTNKDGEEVKNSEGY